MGEPFGKHPFKIRGQKFPQVKEQTGWDEVEKGFPKEKFGSLEQPELSSICCWP